MAENYFEKLEKENKVQRKYIQWLKSCKNCKIYNECTRYHYGITVHGCDYWEDVCGAVLEGYID